MGLFFYSLLGCDSHYHSVRVDKPNSKPAVAKKDSSGGAISAIRQNPYQIGVNWNRKVLSNTNNVSGQIFQLYRYGMGAVGTGTYIGEVGGRHLVMTAAHVYKELSSCKEEVNFLAKSKKFDLYFSCSGWSFELQENDILFFEITSEDDGAFEKLVPAKFSQADLVKGDGLNMVTIERLMPAFDFNWYIDNSSDCILLDDQSRYFRDPDKVSSKDGSLIIRSWSLPIGCDGKHGDSGAPVFDKDFGLVGILWTGKYPKTEVSDHVEALTPGEVWSNFNYMVPMSMVSVELSDVVENQVYMSLETREILSGIREKIKGSAE